MGVELGRVWAWDGKKGGREGRTETLAFGDRLRVPLQIHDGELFPDFVLGEVDALARLDGC